MQKGTMKALRMSGRGSEDVSLTSIGKPTGSLPSPNEVLRALRLRAPLQRPTQLCKPQKRWKTTPRLPNANET